MNNINKIVYLREYIHEVTEEVKQIDASRIQLSNNGYYDLILQRKSLCNLIALAKNELNTHLNQYNFVALGKISSKKGEIRDKVFKGKVYSEFNFPLRNGRKADLSHELLIPLIELIKNEYSHKFLDGKFHIRSLRKAKNVTKILSLT